jgi:hypothetical protein
LRHGIEEEYGLYEEWDTIEPMGGTFEEERLLNTEIVTGSD